MQTVSSFPTSKKHNLITLTLTILGLVLFVFGGSKALSQSNDKEYVEGKPWLQQAEPSSLAPARFTNQGAAGNLLNPVPVSNVDAADTTDSPKEGQTESVDHPKASSADSKQNVDRTKKPAKD